MSSDAQLPREMHSNADTSVRKPDSAPTAARRGKHVKSAAPALRASLDDDSIADSPPADSASVDDASAHSDKIAENGSKANDEGQKAGSVQAPSAETPIRESTEQMVEASSKNASRKPAGMPFGKSVQKPGKDPSLAVALTPADSEAGPAHVTSTSGETVISFRDVTKTYRLYKSENANLLGFLKFKRKRTLVGTVDAVKNMSLEIKHGEAVAFIGRNGAGKSTTLKMVTGVTHPTKGEVLVKGRVSALLELTAGFDKQLTGRENIALRGQIMGLTDDEIQEIEPKVVDFAELGLYIDQPVRMYSSGMRARLGFAFAVAVDPEILVVDEALSVGDAAFRKKCTARIREIMEDKNVTVLFVTHSNATAKEFCRRGVVIHKGQVVFDGAIGDAIKYYKSNC